MERFKRAPVVATPEASNLSSHSRLRVAQHTPEYAAMRAVLLRYLSPILVDSVLERALDARGLTARAVNPAQLPELASDIMVGLRLFVPEQRLSQLMLDLAAVLDFDA